MIDLNEFDALPAKTFTENELALIEQVSLIDEIGLLRLIIKQKMRKLAFAGDDANYKRIRSIAKADRAFNSDIQAELEAISEEMKQQLADI